MFKLIRTRKKPDFASKCVYDDVYKSAICFLSAYDRKVFKFKKEVYNLLDNHIRSCGVCNPEVHLAKGTQTSKTLFAKAIKNGFFRLEEEDD